MKIERRCLCGCSNGVSNKRDFLPGHDRRAEAAILKIHYGGSIAELVKRHGYGPEGKNLAQELEWLGEGTG